MKNVRSANRSGPETLTNAELNIISRVREKYSEYGVIGCTGCKYCQPCPQGVDIPEIFTLYNEYFMKGRDEKVLEKYRSTVPPEKGVKKCAKCGECEEKCPQQLPIRTLLSRATVTLEGNR